jgi:hypothetical protein
MPKTFKNKMVSGKPRPYSMLVDNTLALRWSYLGIMLELLWSYVVVTSE